MKYSDPTGETPAAAGLCFVPGVGWVGCGAVAIGAGIALAVGYVIGQNAVDTTDEVKPSDDVEVLCPPDNNGDDGCTKASDWQLKENGIHDAHAFKRDYVTGSLSKYDICICRGGVIKIKAAGKCGKPGPSIETY